MSFLSVLSAAIPGAVDYQGAKRQAEQNSADRQTSQFEKLLSLTRQQQNDALENRLKTSQIHNYDSEAAARMKPDVETFGDFETVADPVTGQKKVVQRGNRNTIRDTGYAPIEPPKPHQNIDPLSPEGIRAAAERTRLEQGAKPGASPKVSADERKNAAFYQNADAANKLLREAPTPTIGDRTMGGVPVVGNFFTSPQYQRQQQAAYQLSEAWLRATSGAAISENEIKRNALNYFPQPGDDPKTVMQKARSREQVVHSLRQMAGRAIDPNAAQSLEANPDAPYGGVTLIPPPNRP